jgi:hypothetical protein
MWAHTWLSTNPAKKVTVFFGGLKIIILGGWGERGFDASFMRMTAHVSPCER